MKRGRGQISDPDFCERHASMDFQKLFPPLGMWAGALPSPRLGVCMRWVFRVASGKGVPIVGLKVSLQIWDQDECGSGFWFS